MMPIIIIFATIYNYRNLFAQEYKVLKVPTDFAAIQQAINVANNGDTILIAQGTYIENITIAKQIKLQGEDAATTIIDGNFVNRVIDVQNTGVVVIQAMTIQNGLIPPFSGEGAGIQNKGTLTLQDVIIQNNNSPRAAGGIRNLAGTLTLRNTQLISNTGQLGGGIYNFRGNILIEDSLFQNNVAKDAEGVGGAIYNWDGSVTISNTLIISSESKLGGAIYSKGGFVTIQQGEILSNQAIDGGGIYIENQPRGFVIIDSLLENNSATGDAGAIYSLGKMPIDLDRVTIRHNKANLKGGGMMNNGSDLVIKNGVIAQNSAKSAGAGLHHYTGTLSIIDTQIYENFGVDSGGGLNIVDSSLVMTNSTLSMNSATRWGGQLSGYNSTILLANVTVYGQTSNSAIYGFDTIWTLGNTVVVNAEGNRSCFFEGESHLISNGSNLSEDNSCQLANIADFSATPSKLMPFNAQTGVHIPLPTSSLIDNGSNDLCPAFDQLGVARPIDGNGDGSAICDIGAYEYVVPPTAIGLRSNEIQYSHILELFLWAIGLFAMGCLFLFKAYRFEWYSV